MKRMPALQRLVDDRPFFGGTDFWERRARHLVVEYAVDIEAEAGEQHVRLPVGKCDGSACRDLAILDERILARRNRQALWDSHRDRRPADDELRQVESGPLLERDTLVGDGGQSVGTRC